MVKLDSQNVVKLKELEWELLAQNIFIGLNKHLLDQIY